MLSVNKGFQVMDISPVSGVLKGKFRPSFYRSVQDCAGTSDEFVGQLDFATMGLRAVMGSSDLTSAATTHYGRATIGRGRGSGEAANGE